MTRNPYRFDGPALISFSGGRTSGYMLWHILDAWNGQLPEDVHVVFANTGKEREETLRFVHECQTRWSVNIRWLEWQKAAPKFSEVGYNSAARNGEPFAACMNDRSYLPNPVARICTADTKVKVLAAFMRAQGYDTWDNVIGLRADEPDRVAKRRRAKRERKECWENRMPMATASATELDVLEFWQKQDFDLGLRPHEGNCDLCFLKGELRLLLIMAEHPEAPEWWIGMEAARDATFRNDRLPYAQLAKKAAANREALLRNQPTMDQYIEALRRKPAEAQAMFGFLSQDVGHLGDCGCHD